MQAYRPAGLRARAQAAAPTVFRAIGAEHPGDEQWPGLLMLRVEGRVFFANAQSVGDQMWPLIDAREAEGPRARLPAPSRTSSTPRSRC